MAKSRKKTVEILMKAEESKRLELQKSKVR